MPFAFVIEEIFSLIDSDEYESYGSHWDLDLESKSNGQ